LVLNIGAEIVFLFFKQKIKMAMLGDFLLKVGYEVVVPVEELAVLVDVLTVLVNEVKVFFVKTVVLDERLIFWLVDSQLYDGIGQLGELDSFLQETNSSLLEGNSSNSFVINAFNLNFSSSHLVYF
jgi:hypothetical protein